jgi:hypothetical protein
MSWRIGRLDCRISTRLRIFRQLWSSEWRNPGRKQKMSSLMSLRRRGSQLSYRWFTTWWNPCQRDGVKWWWAKEPTHCIKGSNGKNVWTIDFKAIDQWGQLFDKDSIQFDWQLVYRFEIYFIYHSAYQREAPIAVWTRRSSSRTESQPGAEGEGNLEGQKEESKEGRASSVR